MSFGGVTHPHMVNGKGTSSKCNGTEDCEEMPSVCRQLLFGSVMGRREALKACRELEEIKFEQKQRWNFDFETETPLPGRYQWVRVQEEGPLLNGNCNHTRNDTDRDPVLNSLEQEPGSFSDVRAPPTRSQNIAHEGGGAAVDLTKQAQVTKYLKKGKFRSFKTEKVKESSELQSELKQMVSSTSLSHTHQKP